MAKAKQKSTTRRAPASPRDPLAPKNGPLSANVDMAALRAMSMHDLYAFRSAVRTTADVLVALLNAPRFVNDHKMSRAGEALDIVTEFLDSYEQAAINVAKAAKTENATEVDWQSWTILGFEANMMDTLPSFAVTVAEALQRQATAASREKHGKAV